MNVTLTNNMNINVNVPSTAQPTPCSSPIPFNYSNSPAETLPFSVAKNMTENQQNSLFTCKIGAASDSVNVDSVRNAEAESDPLLIPSRPSLSVTSGQSLLQLATPLASPIIAATEKAGAPGETSTKTANHDTNQNDHHQSTTANATDMELTSALMSFAKRITSTSSSSSTTAGDVTKEECPAPTNADSSPTTDSAEKSAESLSAPASPSTKACFSCGTRSTPLWRRSVEGKTVCNACGLYLKSNKTERPAWLKKRLEEARFTIGPDGTLIGNSKCVNCGVTSTPLWRRDGEGNLNCNACGLYYKLHNAARPLDIVKKLAQKKPDQLIQAPNQDQAKSEYATLTSSSSNSTPSSSQHHQMEILRQRKRQRELELLHYQQLQERQTMDVFKYQQLQYNMKNSSRDHYQQYSLTQGQEHHQSKRRRSGSEDHDHFKINKPFSQSGLHLQLPPLVSSRPQLVEAPFSHHHTRRMGNDQYRRTSMDDNLSSRKLGLGQDLQHLAPTKASNRHPNTLLEDSLSSASRSPPTPNHYHGYIASACHEDARDINYDDQYRNPASGLQQRKLPSIHSFLHSHGLNHRGSH